MEKNEIQNLIRQEIEADKRAAQYSVSRVPFHVHNNLDSPQIQFIGLAGVPNTYSGQTGKVVVVNSTETGLSFVASSTIGNSFPLFDHYTTVGNTTTSETDLYSDSIAASTLSANGYKLQVAYGGTFVSSGTATREIRIYFGGTAIFDSGALTLSLSSAWDIYVDIIRVSSTAVRYMVTMTTEGAALAAYTAVGEVTGLTLSNANILKITGQAAGVGAATNDIQAKMGYVVLVKAA